MAEIIKVIQHKKNNVRGQWIFKHKLPWFMKSESMSYLNMKWYYPVWINHKAKGRIK